MKHTLITCPLCGTQFEAESNPSCSTCPVHQNCSMVCCPTCGHTTIDPAQSRLATSFGRLLSLASSLRFTRQSIPEPGTTQISLASALPGAIVRVTGMNGKISPKQRTQLQAYGLVPGRCVRILQQHPVTLVEIEFVELALENEVAQGIDISPA